MAWISKGRYIKEELLKQECMAMLLLILLALVLQVLGSFALSPQGLMLLEFKSGLSDPLAKLHGWSSQAATPCNWTGISCDFDLSVTSLTLPNFQLHGTFPANNLCASLPSLTSLNLSMNNFAGPFPEALLSCTNLTTLDLSDNLFNGTLPLHIHLHFPSLQILHLYNNNFSGTIPDSFGNLPKLLQLALDNNSLTGSIPTSLAQLPKLQYLSLAINPFSPAPIPWQLGNLTHLTYLWLSHCNFIGTIPPSLFNLTNLQTFDLCSNSLSGPIPLAIVTLTSLVQLELYRNLFQGPIPHDFGMLSALSRLDMSNNLLSGPLPSSFSSLKNLTSFQIAFNNLSGELPAAFSQLPLEVLLLSDNSFTGHFPQALGTSSLLNVFDVSYNKFTGPLPPHICDNHALQYLFTIQNDFQGTIPQAYANCPLIRLRLSYNHLTGTVPASLWGLPALIILDLANNMLEGSISSTLGMATNLTTIYLDNNVFTGILPVDIGNLLSLSKFSASHNNLSGEIPTSIGRLIHLSNLDLQDNKISGAIPSVIGNCRQLAILNLSNNQLSESIPSTLGHLTSLNFLDLSNNDLGGQIPESLGALKAIAFNVSDNNLQGHVPNNLLLFSSSFLGNPLLCGDNLLGVKPCVAATRSSKILNVLLAGSFSVTFVILLIGLFFFYRRYWRHIAATNAFDSTQKPSWTSMPFQKLDFHAREIVHATLNDSNFIGAGGYGNVYKTTLSNGQTVAVKQLHTNVHVDNAQNDGGFRAEVETLGKIRHKNIVKLLCCCSNNVDKNLLVYEYMENGSLRDWLHGKKESMLDQATRYRIAVGSAHGLAYLHHDCTPPIVHRDVKSANILLDSCFEAYIADFGLARILEALHTTDVMGTPGYIAPEHCHSIRKITEKSDVYSFGIVLLELVTGKKPLDPEIGDDATKLVKWVSKRMRSRESFEEGLDNVLDRSLSRCCNSGAQQQLLMGRLLRVGMLCTLALPEDRPTMKEVVKMLTADHALFKARLVQALIG